MNYDEFNIHTSIYIYINMRYIGLFVIFLLFQTEKKVPVNILIGLNMCRPANSLPDGVVSARFATTF